jgi:20S proteasome subunit alpha 1
MEAKTITNVFNITENIGCVATGILPDAKAVVTRLRGEAAEYRYKNGHTIPVDILAARAAEIAQVYTQHAYIRPFGVEIIVVGIDDERGPQVFKVDPAGHYCGYRACASGLKEQEAFSFLEKQIKKKNEAKSTLNENDTVQLAIQTLQQVLGFDMKSTDLEVGVVTGAENKFRKLTPEEIEVHLNALANRD